MEIWKKSIFRVPLVLGALGPPGFALLLLTQWAGR